MTSITNKEIDIAVKKTFIAINPEYYSLSMDQQEIYRNSLVNNDICMCLLKHLFGYILKTESKAKDFISDILTPEKKLIYNKAAQLMRGIGNDYFLCTELSVDNKDLLNYNTLYDLDKDKFNNRNKVLTEYGEKPLEDSYICDLGWTWIRFYQDNEFWYGSIISLAYYIVDKLEEKGMEIIDKLIPNEVIDGSKHLNRVIDGVIYDKKINANNLEDQLDELKDKLYEYLKIFNKDIIKRMEELDDGSTYIINQNNDPIDPNIQIIFSNSKALKKVRLKNFVDDYRLLLVNTDNSIDKIINEEIEKLSIYINTEYTKIMANYDPKIKKFKPKGIRIVMTDKFLDDIEKLGIDNI